MWDTILNFSSEHARAISEIVVALIFLSRLAKYKGALLTICGVIESAGTISDSRIQKIVSTMKNSIALRTADAGVAEPVTLAANAVDAYPKLNWKGKLKVGFLFLLKTVLPLIK